MKTAISTIVLPLLVIMLVPRTEGQVLGVNIDPPVSALHVYENTANTGTNAGLTVEQDGATGDAVVQYLLTLVQRWVMGIDNSDADKFKIASDIDLNTNPRLTITTAGDVGIGSTATAPKELLQVGEFNTQSSKVHIEGNDVTGYAASVVFQDQTQASPAGELEIGFYDVDNSFRIELNDVLILSQLEGTDDFDIAGTVVGGFGMIDIAMTTDDGSSDDYTAIIVAANPSDNTVRVRANTFRAENIGSLDNAAQWQLWANFGSPGAGQIMSVSVSISHHLDNLNDFAVIIAARMDDGTTYIRTTNTDNVNIGALDATGSYGGWVSLGNDGF